LPTVLQLGAGALEAAHSAAFFTVISNPANIMVLMGPKGQVKLMTFGLASLRQAEVALSIQTAPDRVERHGCGMGTGRHIVRKASEL